MILHENKRSYFSLEVKLPSFTNLYQSQVRESLEKETDLILGKINASSTIFKFETTQETEPRLIYLFATFQRKRKGQLLNLCEKYFDKGQIEYEVDSFTKGDFRDLLQKIKENKYFKMIERPSTLEDYYYDGDDIDVFEKKQNWYPWQKQLY